jgi:hypothetical protein
MDQRRANSYLASGEKHEFSLDVEGELCEAIGERRLV